MEEGRKGEMEEGGRRRNATFNLTPAACVSLCRSEPARSTRLRRAVLNIGTPSFLSCRRYGLMTTVPHPASTPSSLTPMLQ